MTALATCGAFFTPGVATAQSLAVTSSTPAAGAADVSRFEPLVLNFSLPLNPATVAVNYVDLLSSPNGHRRVDLSVSGPQLTLTPRIAMLPASTYTIEVRRGIAAVGGEGLSQTVRVAFMTRAASWQGARDIASEGRPFDPHINSNGDMFVAVWRQENGALALNRYSPRTGWEQAAVLRTHWFIDRPQVFLDAAGVAHVIWEQNDGTLVSSRHTSATGWSAIEQVPTDSMGMPRRWRGGLDDAGNIIAVWNSDTAANINSAWANRYVPGSGWGTPVLLEGTPGGYVYDLDVAVDSAGRAVAYWLPSHNGQPRLMSRRYIPGSGWAPTEVVNTDDDGVGSVPHMAVRAGQAVVVYSGTSGIMANSHRDGWQAPELISRGLTGYAFWPRVAINDGGDVFAVWVQRGNGPTEEIWGNARSASGVWSTPRRIAVSTAQFTDLRLAIDPARNPMIVVKDTDGTSSAVRSGRYRSGAGWSVETLEASQSQSAAVHTPRIHVDASGSALAVWAIRSNAGGHARANVLE
jgi:hypothetical protein